MSAENNGGTYSPAGPDPQPMPDPLGREQWDKMRMNATMTGSYAVQQGRRDVVVAFLDTGVDQRHRDLRRRAEGDAGGPEDLPPRRQVPLRAIVAAYYYAGLNHFDVASASIGGYLNHSDFNAFYVLLNRAIQFARENGVLPVASQGNDGFDLSDGQFVRDFLHDPSEMPGVVGVNATGYRNDKAFYSNYGVDAADVAAPGGSTRDYSGGSRQRRGASVPRRWPRARRLGGGGNRRLPAGPAGGAVLRHRPERRPRLRLLRVGAGHVDGCSARRGRRGAADGSGS